MTNLFFSICSIRFECDEASWMLSCWLCCLFGCLAWSAAHFRSRNCNLASSSAGTFNIWFMTRSTHLIRFRPFLTALPVLSSALRVDWKQSLEKLVNSIFSHPQHPLTQVWCANRPQKCKNSRNQFPAMFWNKTIKPPNWFVRFTYIKRMQMNELQWFNCIRGSCVRLTGRVCVCACVNCTIPKLKLNFK